MGNTLEPRKRIIQIVHLLYERGLSTGTGGNVALKHGDRLYMTPHGMSTEFRYDIGPDDIIVYDMKGRRLKANKEPSVEANMHLRILTIFPNIGASIHAHPHYASVFAYVQKQIPIVTEAARKLVGEMPIVGVALAGSKELADNVMAEVSNKTSEIEKHGIGMLLALHGVVTVGKTIDQAFTALEAAEEAARCALLSRLLTNC